MKKLFLVAALAAAASMQGCVVTHATGSTVNAKAPADNHIAIVLHDGKFQHSSVAGYKGDKHLATLMPEMLVRMPAVFNRNGVECAALLDGEGHAPTPLPAASRKLHLTPQQATANSQGGSSLRFQAVLVDPALGTIWAGEVRMADGGLWASYGEGAANRAAIDLLVQLRDAKLIDISWRQPEVP